MQNRMSCDSLNTSSVHSRNIAHLRRLPSVSKREKIQTYVTHFFSSAMPHTENLSSLFQHTTDEFFHTLTFI